MKQTVSRYDFHRAFEELRPENFSYEGLNVLFEMLEEWEESTGEEIELDVIALCCDFTESTFEEIAQDYNIDTSEAEDGEEFKEIVIEYLADNAGLYGVVDDMGKYTTVVYQAF